MDGNLVPNLKGPPKLARHEIESLRAGAIFKNIFHIFCQHLRLRYRHEL